jgi:hypothetical protein
MNQNIERLRPPPLPATTEGLLAGKLTNVGRTLNDEVDDVHVVLWANPAYRALHDAVWPEEAVEGSLAADNIFAALEVRKYAKLNKDNEAKYPRIVRAKAATLAKALGYVTRRYGQNRSQRRSTVKGEVVRNGDDE